MKVKKHIAIVCSQLDYPGGIERSIANISHLLQMNDNEVTLIILGNTSASFYPINERVRVIHADLHFGITEKGNMLLRKIAFIKHIFKLRKIILKLKPNVILGTEYNLSIVTWLAARGLKIKIISREAHHFYWIKKNKFWTFLFDIIYPKLDCIICLNKYEQILYNKIGCKTTVIPNYVNTSYEMSYKRENIILTIGWLIKRKGVDLIPEIAKIVFENCKDWKWIIVGDGPELETIKSKSFELGIEDKINIIPPTSHNLIDIYSQASIYVMTSRFEGFPNVLLEAMASSVPCISFDIPSGPSEIITDGIDGMLVESENIIKMSKAIIFLIANNDIRKNMGEAANINIKRFSSNNIYKLWEKLLIN